MSVKLEFFYAFEHVTNDTISNQLEKNQFSRTSIRAVADHRGHS